MRTNPIVPNTSIPPHLNQTPKTNTAQTKPERLAPAMWLRVVAGFDKPFGHDGLPTVWG